jgi:dienelactone hydrolase
MSNQTVTYQADGLNMVGELYLPKGASGRRPGVLVFPEAFGLGQHALSRAERLAELGYVALACDLYGERSGVSDMSKLMDVFGPVVSNPAKIRARATAPYEVLKARPEVGGAPIAAIGFCFGGAMSLELACTGAPIAAAVGFHSGLAPVTAADVGNITGKVLLCLGADDPGISAEQRGAFEGALTQAKVDWQTHLYGGVVHSFTNPEADKMGRPEFARYDARADARSWNAMKFLFEEVLTV